MKKMELIKVASRAYPDGIVELYWDDTQDKISDEHHGDLLAKFITTELMETYEGKKEEETEAVATRRQLVEAQRVLLRAGQELQDVIDALEDQMHPQPMKPQNLQEATTEFLRIRAKEDCLLKIILPKGN